MMPLAMIELICSIAQVIPRRGCRLTYASFYGLLAFFPPYGWGCLNHVASKTHIASNRAGQRFKLEYLVALLRFALVMLLAPVLVKVLHNSSIYVAKCFINLKHGIAIQQLALYPLGRREYLNIL